MKKYIHHKNGNLRKNNIDNLEIVDENGTKVVHGLAMNILCELSNEEKEQKINNYHSKDNCIREDSGKEYEL